MERSSFVVNNKVDGSRLSRVDDLLWETPFQTTNIYCIEIYLYTSRLK